MEKQNFARQSLPLIVLWLLASAIAMYAATVWTSASLVDGHYIPTGNDSFYHARRILDAAFSDRGFYQFDDMIHVPDGSWLNWPWAYDYLMSRAVLLAVWISPGTEPMAFLAYVPVAWLLVNMGLLTLVCRQVGLRPALTATVLLGFALLPLTQSLHGTGSIDHHFMELTFVLATVLAGLRFFAADAGRGRAVTLGLVLAAAPGFHNGLFILQIPVLVAAALGWFRHAAPAAAQLRWLAATLFAGTLLVVLPSGPFLDLQFEFWTLSWFHLYVAACSAIFLLLIAWKPCDGRSLAVVAGACILLFIPLVAKLVLGAEFLTGKLILLEHVVEVRSPLSQLAEPNGVLWITSYYSWLIVLAPVLLLVFGARIFRERAPDRVFLAVTIAFGMLLMATQFRLHPFGSWALAVGSALLWQEIVARYRIPELAGTAAALLVVAVALQPALKYRLFQRQPPGLTRDYAIVRALFPALADACREAPGPVLSYNDDGHYIRYHTDCSVLTNNFLLTPEHEEKIRNADRYLQMSPRQFAAAAPDIRYLFVRMYGIYRPGPNGMEPTPVQDVAAQNAPLFVGLTFGDDIPDVFERVAELRVDDPRDFAYASVYRIRTAD